MHRVLFAILLLEGFISISVEILTIRQLTPFFGGSIVITSIIIGVFLLFLALGYWRGGSYPRDFFNKLSQNFALSMLWIGIGLNYTFVALFFYFTTVNLSFPYLFSLTLYLLFVLAPIAYWLGQTIPLTTNLFNQQQRISRISGYALFLSTVGSFLGALITSLLLFQFVGVAWAVVINCLFLFGLVLLLQPHSGVRWWLLLLLGFALYCIKLTNIDSEKLHFQLTNNYANYRVTETTDQTRMLEINLSPSSMLTAQREGFAYIEFIRDFLFKQLALRNKEMLVIGAGGFTLTAAGDYNNQVTYIDIDPAIKPFAEKYFLQKKINGRFIGQDARRFLNQTSARYDVIISDVYSHQVTIPPALLTVEYFQQLAGHLTPSGLLVVNVVRSPFFSDHFSRRVDNTIHQVFSFCAVVPLNWQSSLSNIIYICSNHPHDDTLYTDNLNSATFDFFQASKVYTRNT